MSRYNIMRNVRENKFINLRKQIQQTALKGWQYEQNQPQTYANDNKVNIETNPEKNDITDHNISKILNRNVPSDKLSYSCSDPKILSSEKLPLIRKFSRIKPNLDKIKVKTNNQCLNLPTTHNKQISLFKSSNKKLQLISKSLGQRSKDIKSIQKNKRNKTDREQQKINISGPYNREVKKLIYLQPCYNSQIGESNKQLKKKIENNKQWYTVIPPSVKIKQMKFRLIPHNDSSLQKILNNKKQSVKHPNNNADSFSFNIFKNRNKKIKKNQEYHMQLNINNALTNFTHPQLEFNDGSIFSIEGSHNKYNIRINNQN